MSVKQFEPKFMKVGVLTAALQELTPRERRDPDPDLSGRPTQALPARLPEPLQYASRPGCARLRARSRRPAVGSRRRPSPALRRPCRPDPLSPPSKGVGQGRHRQSSMLASGAEIDFDLNQVRGARKARPVRSTPGGGAGRPIPAAASRTGARSDRPRRGGGRPRAQCPPARSPRAGRHAWRVGSAPPRRARSGWRRSLRTPDRSGRASSGG